MSNLGGCFFFFVSSFNSSSTAFWNYLQVYGLSYLIKPQLITEFKGKVWCFIMFKKWICGCSILLSSRCTKSNDLKLQSQILGIHLLIILVMAVLVVMHRHASLVCYKDALCTIFATSASLRCTRFDLYAFRFNITTMH